MVKQTTFLIKFLMVLAGHSILSACASSQREVSADGVLPSDKLVLVLADLHEVDGVMVVSGTQAPKLDSIGTLAYDRIFKQNACTPRQLEASLAHYHAVPDTMDGIYRRVIEVLNQRITNAESTQRKEQATKRAAEVPRVKPKGAN